MTDIVTVALLLCAAAGGYFWLGIRCARLLGERQLYRRRLSLTLASLAGLIAWVLLATDNLALIRLLPVTGILLIANATMPLTALLVGLMLPQMTNNRRILWGTLLLAASGYQSFALVLGSPPETRATAPEDGIVRQTTDTSCGAAGAATLLLARHIPATEPEMARLCLTRAPGTSLMGVYRGLRFKTDGTPWRISLLSGANVDDLRRTVAAEGPVLISVGLDRWPRWTADRRYETEWGWVPGQRHVVVLFRFLPGGSIDVGDPASGRETWPEESLGVLWHGDGLALSRNRTQ